MWAVNYRTVIAICLICLTGAGSALLAQGHRAIISGLVVDASGASVPGAEVRVIHQSTNIAHNTITSDKCDHGTGEGRATPRFPERTGTRCFESTMT